MCCIKRKQMESFNSWMLGNVTHQINIKYSRSQVIGKSYFTGIFKEVPKEIKVSRIDSDLLLDDESISEEMLVADGSKTNFNPKICKSWVKIVYGDFGSAKCDESDSTNIKVIATKSDDNGTNNKKKLRGGEIALLS